MSSVVGYAVYGPRDDTIVARVCTVGMVCTMPPIVFVNRLSVLVSAQPGLRVPDWAAVCELWPVSDRVAERDCLFDGSL
jgi:hypothetical protein